MNFNFPQDLQNDLKVNSKKSVVVVLNSAKSSSGSVANANYNFDWSVLPNIPYYVYFSFVGRDSTSFPVEVPIIYIDFGASSSTYSVIANNYGASTSNYLGTLQKMPSSTTTNYLFSDKFNNPPIYLSNRPTNKSFQVQIKTDQDANFDTNSLAVYVLTLYFEPA
jgi:hypothetical protein